MARLGALAELDFDHLDLVQHGSPAEFFLVKMTIGIATAEISAAQFPDYVAAMFGMISAERSFARIMIEIAPFRAEVQGFNRPVAERAEAHSRDVEDRSRIGLRALRAANGDTEFLGYGVVGRHGMAEPFIFIRIDIQFGSEGMGGHLVF